MRPWRASAILTGVLLATLSGGMALAAPDPNVEDLQSLVNGKQDPPKTLVLNPKSLDTRYKLAVGVSYTGAQLRYQFSPQWAAEYRYQFGKASSDYGDVKATVIGFRGYRFIPFRRSLYWYLGGEGDYASAKVDNTVYDVHGFVMGGFGGMEYRILPRLAISTDIGPYMISLKEKESGVSQTNLDFVINTAINFYLF